MPDFDRLLLHSAEPFANGAADYWDAYPGLEETHPRIYVRFRPEGIEPHLSFLALLDTGAHYCILNAGVIALLSDQLTASIGTMELQTARGLIPGTLHRHGIKIMAEAGKDLIIDATLLVCPEWQGPNFLGYVGALDRLRFAIHPFINRFYFGPLD